MTIYSDILTGWKLTKIHHPFSLLPFPSFREFRSCLGFFCCNALHFFLVECVLQAQDVEACANTSTAIATMAVPRFESFPKRKSMFTGISLTDWG